MKLALALSLVSSLAFADSPKVACKVPTGKIAVTVGPELSLDDFATWVMGTTCKAVVFDVQHGATKLKVMAPKELTTAQLEKLFVESLAAVGYTAKVSADSIVISGGCANATAEDPLQKLVDTEITSVDSTHKKVTARFVDELLKNPMGFAKGARVVPAVKDGKPQGFKLYAIRPSSFYAKLGLENGDTLVEVNGFPIVTADKALEVYAKLRDAKAVELSLIRRGQPVKIFITID